MMIHSNYNNVLNVRYPIIQAGMVWCSGWKLVKAVAENGALGTLGAGSMKPDILIAHIQTLKSHHIQHFAVNIPLISKYASAHVEICINEKIPIIITSAGDPNQYTHTLKASGSKVMHVVSSTKHAKKAELVGVDAIIAEGFEAGGHNGRDETTTLCLLQNVIQNVSVPVYAAGGIGTGSAILAMQALGAEGVQIGSLFASTVESSAHLAFKNKVIETKEGDTMLTLKDHIPVRMTKNMLYQKIKALQFSGLSDHEIAIHFGSGLNKLGIFEGNTTDGEIEIGQIAALIHDQETVSSLMNRLIKEYTIAKKRFD